ncbi:MAG: two-component system response regulator RegA, partial [Myxococcota bacterium]
MMSETETILLVDDDETFRTRLARAFTERGFDVLTAGDVEEARQIVRNQPVDKAILDLRMPGPSGLEAIGEFTAKQIQTVVLTGFGSIATAIEAMRLGATYYLAKPADADEIISAFNRGDQHPLDAASEEYTAPSLARAEWEHISRVLSDCGGNVSRAARALGIHRRSLQRKL